ncbi:thioredoxin domain-containing protein [filamentous cyanobacterium LEGE 11480]|uniref:Thioredoxin domain-containing protein n=1 Tax=Romeriopsis navalis LEGE 11480 TaxID=2777977 RepID=A0A928Z3N0_9CYAN|nr:thioredoxin domain-containing protein [Romeriopsis navalis]MBE9030859.1 thioredoxin domain-containing protein [Romeriopsis navalis LEGE 11480]
MQGFNYFNQRVARQSLIGMLLLMVALTSCSNPVNADNPVNSDLEKQVLEIIRKNPEVILESVSKYQREQQEQQSKARENVISQITSKPAAIIGKSPKLGQGKTLLIEFSDFQCPFCAEAHKNIKQFVKKRSGEVTLVYKHLPLEQIHPEAVPAAQAAWAAQQQGKFWEFHDAMFENQDRINPDFYQETAKQLGLDLEKFERDRKSKTAQKAVEDDLKLARSLEISGTPTFIMNGQLFSGAVPVEELEKRLAQ